MTVQSRHSMPSQQWSAHIQARHKAGSGLLAGSPPLLRCLPSSLVEAARAFQARTQRRQAPMDTTRTGTFSLSGPHLGPEALRSKVSAQAVALLGILCLRLPRLLHFSRLGCNLGAQTPQLALGTAYPAHKGTETWPIPGQQGGLAV